MSEQVDKLIAGIERGLERATGAVALAIHDRLVQTTPVDTGWAKGNWIPSVGQPFADVVGTPPTKADGPGSKLGTGQAEQAQGVASLLTFKLRQGSCFVTNNVRYISGPGSLDDGHSKQQPRGFIRRGIEDGVNEVVHDLDDVEKAGAR